MSACICTLAPPPVDVDAMLRYARADITSTALARQTIDELGARFQYTVCYRTYPVRALADGELDLGFCRVHSASLTRFVGGRPYVLVFGATVGLTTDAAVIRYGHTSPTRALFADALGIERIESLCDAFCMDKVGTTSRFSPGYGDLPLEMQRQIFEALPLGKIGMTLNDNLLITPTKSVTALVAVDKEVE